MAISMRVLDGDQPGGVAVEWCDGARCIRREITGPWPDGFQAVQAAVLAELAGGVVVANQEEPEPASYLDAPPIDVPVFDRATGEPLPDPALVTSDRALVALQATLGPPRRTMPCCFNCQHGQRDGAGWRCRIGDADGCQPYHAAHHWTGHD